MGCINNIFCDATLATSSLSVTNDPLGNLAMTLQSQLLKARSHSNLLKKYT